MDTWEYRVYKEGSSYTLREHYDHEEGGSSYTAGPAHPIAFDDDERGPIESLRWQLHMMLQALERAVIEVSDDGS